MSGLPKFFEATSDGLYDRHHYKLILGDNTSIEFEDYESIRQTWFKTPKQFLSHVEITDKPTQGIGFL